MKNSRCNSLSKRLCKQFCSRPFFVRLNFSKYFSFERYICFLSESEIVDIFIEKS